MKNNGLVLTGFVGLIAAMLVGYGEASLHYSSLGFGGEEYKFFTGVSREAMTRGHFVAAFSIPFYLVGFFHIFEMITATRIVERLMVPVLCSYGLFVGGIWLGSRSYLGFLAQLRFNQESQILTDLLVQYSFLNETLLWGTRIAILFASVILVIQILKNKTRYPKWMAFFNPIATVIYCFITFAVIPSIGQYLMPIAMNVAFFVFFALSIRVAMKVTA